MAERRVCDCDGCSKPATKSVGSFDFCARCLLVMNEHLPDLKRRIEQVYREQERRMDQFRDLQNKRDDHGPRWSLRAGDKDER